MMRLNVKSKGCAAPVHKALTDSLLLLLLEDRVSLQSSIQLAGSQQGPGAISGLLFGEVQVGTKQSEWAAESQRQNHRAR